MSHFLCDLEDRQRLPARHVERGRPRRRARPEQKAGDRLPMGEDILEVNEVPPLRSGGIHREVPFDGLLCEELDHVALRDVVFPDPVASVDMALPDDGRGNDPFPAQPRDIELTPPPLNAQATIDTSGKPDKKTRAWQGSVQYDFVTAPQVQITGAHLEPVSQDKADVAAAKRVSIVSTFPIEGSCGTPTAVELSSKDARAHANLVIDTNDPSYPHWTTRVDFAPQPQGAL